MKIKNYLRLMLVTTTIALCINQSSAQVDSLHYIPPMCSFTNSTANVDDHQMVLTTSEITAFDVTIRNNDGTFVRTVSLSSSSPQKVDLNWPGRVLNSQGVIGTSDLNTVLDTEGLIVSGSKNFFVNIQQKSRAQGDLLTSKGTTGWGTDFFSGHMFSSQGSYDSQNGHFISVMATENNTNVTFSNPRMLFSGQTNNNFIISMDKGQSYVIGVSINQLKSQGVNLNHVNGTHITSNKPIAVSSGSWCAAGKPGNNPGRDVGFDQLVPAEVVGQEYILIKGEGNSSSSGARNNERAIIVATENNTNVYLNGSSSAVANLDIGEYHITSYGNYSSNGNLYINSDKKVFVFQTLSGADKKQTAGFCFIPPLKCTADKEVTIAFANKLSSLTVNPVLKLVSQQGATIQINGSTVSGFNRSVTGNSDWETFNIPRSTLANHLDNGNWNFQVTSSHALNAMLAVESNNVGGGGFYSGFGDIPQVNQSPEIAEQGLCGDNVLLTASGFVNYNWYKDGTLISANDDDTYEPSEPGRYKVTGLSPCGSSTTESFPSNEIRILPCLSVSNPTITVTEGSDLMATFTVSLSHSWAVMDNVDVTFDYQTTAGTATSGKDFTPKTGSATIESGNTSIDIDIPIINDILNENSETFTFSISNVSEAVESITLGTCTILDDNDTEPTISVNNQTVNEDAGTIILNVDLNTESGKTITVDYNISDNTANRPEDYTSAAYSGTFTYAPGETNKNISIAIQDDQIYEPGVNEFFTISLSNLNNVSAGNSSADISIVDNENPPIISIADASAEEGLNIIFQAVLNHAADVDITFDYAIQLSTGPNKAKSQDFINYSSFSTGTVTIPAGQLTANFPAFVTDDDNANENAETFAVAFSSVSNASLGNPSATGTILDNEGHPTLSIQNANSVEGNTISFTITVSPIKSTDIIFEYRTLDGSAISPADYSGVSGWTAITMPANQSSISLDINTIQDTEEEGTETFTVEINESQPQVELGISTATGTINDDDETPDARDDNYSVNEDDVLANNVMNNDLGLGDPPVTVVSNTNPANGILVINTDGSFTYTPTANYNGNDSFTYTIRDVDNDEDTATVNITVNPQNDIPVANADSYTIPEDTALNDDVSTNDQNLFDLPISFSLVSDVSDGTLNLNGDGTFSYTPNSEFFGDDHFTYQITDGNGDAVTANVTITVLFNNDAAPVAVNDNTSTNEDTAVVIDVLANDSDIDGNQTIDKASVLIKSNPSNGSLNQNFVTGEVTYTPNSNYTGSDSFTYTIQDNSGLESNVATVSINVTVDNDPPVALCKSGVTIYLDTTGNYTLTPAEVDNGSNDDNDEGTVSLAVSPNTFDCSDKGTVSVTLTVTDEDLASTNCSTNITIADNSAPTIKTVQADITVDADAGTCTKTVNYSGPVFTDNCDGDQSGNLTAGLPSGSSFAVGTTLVTYQYTDASGNGPVSSSFNVIVNDNEDPQANNNADQNLTVNTTGCQHQISGTGYDLTATDNCGILSITHNYDGGGSSLNGKLFSEGSTTVQWTITDINSNSITENVVINVSTDLSVSLSGPSDNESCSNSTTIFTATGSGGNSPYTYQFYVNGTEVTAGVSGDTFTTTDLNQGDIVKARISDVYGCWTDSNEITMTIFADPNPLLFHE
jgi:hypothetical protein